MRRIVIAGMLAGVVACSGSTAQSPAPSGETYRLSMFQLQNRTFAGLVVGEDLIVDLAEANAAYEREADVPALTLPEHTNEIIARYGELRDRLAAIAAAVAEAGGDAAYVHQADAVDILPPVEPRTILNAPVSDISAACSV